MVFVGADAVQSLAEVHPEVLRREGSLGLGDLGDMGDEGGESLMIYVIPTCLILWFFSGNTASRMQMVGDGRWFGSSRVGALPASWDGMQVAKDWDYSPGSDCDDRLWTPGWTKEEIKAERTVRIGKIMDSLIVLREGL